MGSFGKILIVFGIILIIVGALFTFGSRFSWFGHLPGDIYVQKKNFTFFFPITTSILISLLLSIIMIILKKR